MQESDLKETDGLYPCAYETIWSVRDVEGIMYLDMTLNQSNDYIMAGYINKIQYVALQMMVASHLNYKVGKFCHFIQNLHIYDRHIKQNIRKRTTRSTTNHRFTN
jgi:thymidylate synthase